MNRNEGSSRRRERPAPRLRWLSGPHDLNANLLFKWKRQDEAGELGGALVTGEAPEFVPIGGVGRSGDGGPALLARMPDVRAPAAGAVPATRAGAGDVREALLQRSRERACSAWRWLLRRLS